jgi:hypothetical protein
MGNQIISMIALLYFTVYELYFLTNIPKFFNHTLILNYIIFINIFPFVLFYFFLDAFFFQKLPSIGKFMDKDKNIFAKMRPQLIIIFLIIYILIVKGKIPPAGNFSTDQITIFNNTTFCDFYSIPNCILQDNNITIPAKINIKYLINTQKLISFDYINNQTNTKEKIYFRFNDADLRWEHTHCSTSFYYMNVVSPYFK